MTTSQLPISRSVGETENSLRALLGTIVARTPIASYERYLCMALIGQDAGGIRQGELLRQVAATLGVAQPQAGSLIDELVADRLVREAPGTPGTIELSGPGKEALMGARQEIRTINGRLEAGIPEDDLAASRRTLSTILDRARAELANQPRTSL